MKFLQNRLSARAPGGQFLRFAVVGAMGFCVDAGVLLALVAAGWAAPIGARLASFACAVVVTFEMNRRWSFGDTAQSKYAAKLATYIGVQGLGFLCNLGIYTLAMVMFPPSLKRPLFCLALASGLALVINFAGARLFVFRRSRA